MNQKADGGAKAVLQGNQMKGPTESRTMQNGEKWRPGMEQFVNSIKLKSSGDTITLSMPQGLKLPEVLRPPKTAAQILKKIE